MATHPQAVGSEICAALNLDPNSVSRVAFDWDVNSKDPDRRVGLVHVRQHVLGDGSKQLAQVFKKYVLMRVDSGEHDAAMLPDREKEVLERVANIMAEVLLGSIEMTEYSEQIAIAQADVPGMTIPAPNGARALILRWRDRKKVEAVNG